MTVEDFSLKLKAKNSKLFYGKIFMSSKAMTALVESLMKLPGVGAKIAARLAYHVVELLLKSNQTVDALHVATIQTLSPRVRRYEILHGKFL